MDLDPLTIVYNELVAFREDADKRLDHLAAEIRLLRDAEQRRRGKHAALAAATGGMAGAGTLLANWLLNLL